MFVVTRSPEIYNVEFNAEEEIREINENECVTLVSEVKLDCNQKSVDPFFPRENREIQMFINNHNQSSIYQKEL